MYNPKESATKQEIIEIMDKAESMTADHIRESTERLRKDDRRRILEHLPDGNIDKHAIQKMINSMSDAGYAPSVIDSAYERVRAAFRTANEMGLTYNRDLRGIRIPKVNVPEKHFATDDEYQKVIDATPVGDIVRFVIIMANNVGLSMVDACLLQWKSVDMERCFVTSQRQKSGAMFRVPFLMGDDTWTELNYWHQRRDDLVDEPPNAPEEGRFYVQPALAIRYMTSRQSVNSRIAYQLKRLGIKGPKGNLIHCFRRAFVSRIANSGANHIVTMEASGHKSIHEFRKYVKISDEAIRTALTPVLQQSQLRIRLKNEHENR